MKLVVPNALMKSLAPRLLALAPACAVVRYDDEGRLDGDAGDAVALLSWWTPNEVFLRTLAAAPRTRWIHTFSTGVDHLLVPGIVERDIVLTNSAGAHAVPIAEFVLMYLLAHVKRAPELLALGPEEGWEHQSRLRLDELCDHTMLIVGLGSIGEQIARRAAAFGMRVLGSRRNPRPTQHMDLVVGEDGWRDLLPQADYVVIAAPLTSSTRGMVDAAAFARMRPGAYLVNIARGPIVDTDALLAALHSGRIAGAAIDTPPLEPLPPDHPLWRAPNTWVTPHISYSSPRTMERMLDIFFENLRRFRLGEPLLNVVDKQAGY
jgi:phosphoglycerate dehydrogenase-like enzyme